MFVAEQLEAVTSDGNTIWVRTKLDYGRYSAFMDELRAAVGEKGSLLEHLGALNLALLTHLVVKWEGPAFAGTPCTPEQIRRLDPEAPLVEAAVRAVNRYNPLARLSADPKAATNVGAPT